MASLLFYKGGHFIKITDEEIAAAECVVPVVRLIEQIVTYRRPGAYQFAEDFPDESATWREVSTLFRKSPVKEVRDFGELMAEMGGGLMTVDKVAQEGSPKELKRAVAALCRSAKALNKAWSAFSVQMIREAVADNGI
ncbi:hypothetical protein [Fontibacillus sp. BL9]|uniref:hypothetical protein n=1 Tax=Fontibacillus sp. BL9 TaxID=3389971 RepID=UPI0039798FB8